MSKPNVSIGGARISWNSHRTLTIFIFLTKRAGITDIRDSGAAGDARIVHTPRCSKNSGTGIYRENELYDLDNDPYELRNLAGLDSYRDISDRLKQRLLKHILSVEGETPEIVDAEKRSGGQAILPANQMSV